MKIFKALFISLLAALLTAFMSAIVILLTDLYLSSKGIDWHTPGIEYGFVSMSYVDAVLLFIVLLVFCLVFFLLTRKDRFGNTPLD